MNCRYFKIKTSYKQGDEDVYINLNKYKTASFSGLDDKGCFYLRLGYLGLTKSSLSNSFDSTDEHNVHRICGGESAYKYYTKLFDSISQTTLFDDISQTK